MSATIYYHPVLIEILARHAFNTSLQLSRVALKVWLLL